MVLVHSPLINAVLHWGVVLPVLRSLTLLNLFALSLHPLVHCLPLGHIIGSARLPLHSFLICCSWTLAPLRGFYVNGHEGEKAFS